MKRLSYVDAETLKSVSEGRREEIEKLRRQMRDEPDRAAQTRYWSLAFDYSYLALAAYALGAELPDIVANFRESALAYLHVLQYRGTNPHPSITFH